MKDAVSKGSSTVVIPTFVRRATPVSASEESLQAISREECRLCRMTTGNALGCDVCASCARGVAEAYSSATSWRLEGEEGEKLMLEDRAAARATSLWCGFVEGGLVALGVASVLPVGDPLYWVLVGIMLALTVGFAAVGWGWLDRSEEERS